MKLDKKNIIKIVCLTVIVVASILLIVFMNNRGKDKQLVEEKTEEASNNQSILSNDVINDLKNNIGKGTNGDIVDVVQSKNEKGEDQYIFTYIDGTTQTITIKDQEGGSGVEEIEVNPQEDNPQEEEPIHEDEEEEPQEDLGTVYERYANMSKYEQYAFYKTFDSQSDFVEWYKAAQAEYLKLHPKIEVGKDQVIDFGS